MEQILEIENQNLCAVMEMFLQERVGGMTDEKNIHIYVSRIITFSITAGGVVCSITTSNRHLLLPMIHSSKVGVIYVWKVGNRVD